jgi:hypothetical protein
MKPIPNAEDPDPDQDEQAAGKAGDFEDLLSHLGQFGSFQKWLYFLLWMPAGAMAIGIYASVYLEFVPKHHCQLPETCLQDDDAQDWIATLDDPSCTIPRILNDSCMANDLNDVIQCQEITYDQSLFTSTVISDFDATCQDKYIRTISSTVYMSGMLFGSLIFGWISDAFGRRISFGLCVLSLALGSTCAAFSPNYPTYMMFRFLTSMGGMGCFMTSFVLATEFVGSKYRTMCGIILELPFAFGELYVTMLAYFIRDWRTLQVS